MSKDHSLNYICKNVRILRIINHLSLQKMAKITGIGVGSLRKLEAGILPPRLSCDFVFSAADYFQIPAHVLFCPIPGMEELYGF